MRRHENPVYEQNCVKKIKAKVNKEVNSKEKIGQRKLEESKKRIKTKWIKLECKKLFFWSNNNNKNNINVKRERESNIKYINIDSKWDSTYCSQRTENLSIKSNIKYINIDSKWDSIYCSQITKNLSIKRNNEFKLSYKRQPLEIYYNKIGNAPSNKVYKKEKYFSKSKNVYKYLLKNNFILDFSLFKITKFILTIVQNSTIFKLFFNKRIRIRYKNNQILNDILNHQKHYKENESDQNENQKKMKNNDQNENPKKMKNSDNYNIVLITDILTFAIATNQYFFVKSVIKLLNQKRNFKHRTYYLEIAFMVRNKRIINLIDKSSENNINHTKETNKIIFDEIITNLNPKIINNNNDNDSIIENYDNKINDKDNKINLNKEDDDDEKYSNNNNNSNSNSNNNNNSNSNSNNNNSTNNNSNNSNNNNNNNNSNNSNNNSNNSNNNNNNNNQEEEEKEARINKKKNIFRKDYSPYLVFGDHLYLDNKMDSEYKKLCIACLKGNENELKRLAESGINLNRKFGIYQFTPLMILIYLKNYKLAKFLIKNYAKRNIGMNKNNRNMDQQESMEININSKDKYNNTPFLYMLKYQPPNKEMYELLLQYGTSINFKLFYHRPLLHCLVKNPLFLKILYREKNHNSI